MIQTLKEAQLEETQKSAFPTVPRKKIKNPDRIKHIFVDEKKRNSICDSRYRGLKVGDMSAAPSTSYKPN